MSFRKIKIVKKFSKPKQNISLGIAEQSKPKSPTNATEPIEYSNDTRHYIGLLFVNSISINKLHSMKWDKPEFTYLNLTNIYLENGEKYPIVKLEDNMITDDFRYKAFIRNFIFDTYGVTRKDVISIKLYETHGKLHNYVVILKNISCLSSNNKRYSWRKIINLYNIPFEAKKFTQKEIYSFIIGYQDPDLWCKYKFSVDNSLKQYNQYTLEYKKLMHILSKVKFTY